MQNEQGHQIYNKVTVEYIAGYIWIARIQERMYEQADSSDAYNLVKSIRMQFVHEMSAGSLIVAQRLHDELSAA